MQVRVRVSDGTVWIGSRVMSSDLSYSLPGHVVDLQRATKNQRAKIGVRWSNGAYAQHEGTELSVRRRV